jgi:hypothetical protein
MNWWLIPVIYRLGQNSGVSNPASAYMGSWFCIVLGASVLLFSIFFAGYIIIGKRLGWDVDGFWPFT